MPVWLALGGALITAGFLGTLLWAALTRAASDARPANPALTIEVTGKQWWWQVRYLGDDPSQNFETANEIRIPVGEPVRVRLISTDVIHSFWVPAIAGKTDMIPGQTNVTWLEATKPGAYRAQCAEFCGLQHARMALWVVAETPEDFAAWRAAQLAPAPAAETPEVEKGLNAFVLKCGVCHAVRGTQAGGKLGPDLSNLMSRRSLAAGTLPNTPGHLSAWIADPQRLKPGSQMPRIDLAGDELASIRAFLETLE